jgi:uncharacterized membrane protein YfcA
MYIGIKMIMDIVNRKAGLRNKDSQEQKPDFEITQSRFSLKQAEFKFAGQKYSFSVPGVFSLCFSVGIIGGVYGIGGGAIIAPIFVAFFHIPVYAVAGAALMGTFVTSILGVLTYQVLAYIYTGVSVAPDWYLGLLFGIGGFFGMYLGARCQKYVSVKSIKLILCFCVLFLAFKYILDFVK